MTYVSAVAIFNYQTLYLHYITFVIKCQVFILIIYNICYYLLILLCFSALHSFTKIKNIESGTHTKIFICFLFELQPVQYKIFYIYINSLFYKSNTFIESQYLHRKTKSSQQYKTPARGNRQPSVERIPF